MIVGIITSIASFDRETKPSYDLVVVVSDGGALSCRIDVTVDLRDVNDNEPVFDAALDPMRVREDAPVNTTLVRVTATDSDLGLYFFMFIVIPKIIRVNLFHNPFPPPSPSLAAYLNKGKPRFEFCSQSRHIFAGLYGLVGFELSSDSKEFFSIDPKSGILSLRKSLDRERQDRHNVTIFAHDEVNTQALRLNAPENPKL